jgi:triosephosphate isomerase
MGVIVCVGERGEASGRIGRATVTAQLKASLPLVADAAAHLSVGYEPVWAIGTGRVPTVQDVGEMHRAIRAVLVEDLWRGGAGCAYSGGSVTSENAAQLLGADEVCGALVGDQPDGGAFAGIIGRPPRAAARA